MINLYKLSENTVHFKWEGDEEIKKVNCHFLDGHSKLPFYKNYMELNKDVSYFITEFVDVSYKIFNVYDMDQNLIFSKDIYNNGTKDIREKDTLNIFKDYGRDAKLPFGLLGVPLYEIFFGNEYSFADVKVEPNDIVFDIGANVGIFSMMSVHYQKAKTCYSFEPVKEIYDFTNSRSQSTPQIQLYNVAVGATSHESYIDIRYDGVQSKINDHTQGSSSDGLFERRLCKVVGLNDFIRDNNITKIDFMKIDCEGNEYEIIEALDLSIVRKFAIEFHDNDNKQVSKIVDKLTKSNFKVLMKNDTWLTDDSGMIYAIKNEIKFEPSSNLNVKLVHILTDVESEREKKSIESIKKLTIFNGIKYIQQVNIPFKGEFPPCTDGLGLPYYEGHYGAYLSFKKAIEDNFTEDLDALLLCECDCVLRTSPLEFYMLIKKVLKYCSENGIYQFSFGGNYWWVEDYGKQYLNGGIIFEENEYYIVDQIVRAHCILLTKESRNFYLSKMNMPWEPADMWLNTMVKGFKKQAVTKTEVAYQYPGLSLIEKNRVNDSTRPLPWYTQFDFSDVKNNINCKFNISTQTFTITGDFKEKFKIEYIYDNDIKYREHEILNNSTPHISKTTFEMRDINKIEVKFYLSDSDFYLFKKEPKL